MMLVRSALVAFSIASLCHAAPQIITKYGMDFCVIGDPVNRGSNQFEAPGVPSRGSVHHAYALGKTEISIGQWYQFVDAYGQFVPATQAGLTFLGTRGIGLDFSRPSGYGLNPDAQHLPVEVGWRYAAMYCNWLTNNKVNEKWAFETGAYDVSSFGYSNGKYTDQATHSASAKFWIPSLDEWIKGTYYDSNRYGPGQDGFWKNPGGQDVFLQSGAPSQGGKTSAGYADGYNLPVGSYPNTSAPWGLLDTSGGVQEWTENLERDRSRTALGSAAQTPQILGETLSDYGTVGAPDFNIYGIRLATVVPSPSSVLLLVPFIIGRRKRLIP